MADQSVRSALRAPQGPVSLSEFDPRATALAPGGKTLTRTAAEDDGAAMARLQEALYAEGAGGSPRRVLLVMQGMDTSGKGGVIKHVIGAVNPQGSHIRSFKKPTPAELSHHFLWRIRKEVPQPGLIGIFDRSHYEDVLIARVRRLVPVSTWEKRYAEINRFEHGLVESGVQVIKCFLHISFEEQKERLLARLDDPEKQWKFNPGDIDERKHWPAYAKAYEAVLNRTNTELAPWYVVPSDRKWYRNWAIGRLLIETLNEMDPQFPAPDYDVEEQRRRLTDVT
ncbi:MAG: polyphosphate kinase 2 family protein [Actinomycetota bacterium]|nr:polyphosphate kinase 2 family protein [Actinomycetota bacterium]